MSDKAPHPADYRPYETHPAFMAGYAAYCKNNWISPHDPDSVDAQAWDRGADYARRLARWNAKGV